VSTEIVLLLLGAAALAALTLFFVRSRGAPGSEDGLRHRQMLEHLPQSAVIVFDRDLVVVDAVGPALGQAGIDPRTLRGRPFADVVAGEHRERLERLYRDGLDGRGGTVEYVSALDGRDYSVTAVPLEEGVMAVAEDITESKRAQRAREAAEDTRLFVVEAINEAYVAIDPAGLIRDWNERASAIFGYSRDEVLGRNAKEIFVPPEDHREFDWLIRTYLTGERSDERLDLRLERTAIDREGRRFPVELSSATRRHGDEMLLHSFMHDISDRKRDEQELAAHATDVEELADAIGELARTTDPHEARQVICRSAGRIADADVTMLFEPDGDGRGLRASGAHGAEVLDAVVPFVGSSSGAVRAFTSREQLFVADVRGHPGVVQSLVEATGAVSALWVPVLKADTVVGVVTIVWRRSVEQPSERLTRAMGLVAAEASVAIERAELLKRLARMARTDDLTGLPNRRAWDREVGRELARSRRDGRPLSVAMIDLDMFKAYNDRLGHQAGDRLLKEAAVSWSEALRDTDTLARYGGEEFALILPDCPSAEAMTLVERLRSGTPGGQSCSAGVATWDGREGIDALVGRADRALYAAKQAGRNRAISDS
jgi:diguanylate cyclase (GGDEF)-like protein/PAS domain S-box-containing protein